MQGNRKYYFKLSYHHLWFNLVGNNYKAKQIWMTGGSMRNPGRLRMIHELGCTPVIISHWWPL